MNEGMTLMIGPAMIDRTIVVEEGEVIGLMIDPIVQGGMTEEAEEDTLHAEIGVAMIEGEGDTTEGILEVMIEEEEGAMIGAIEVIHEDIPEEAIEVILGAMFHEATEVTQEDTIVGIAEAVMNREAVDTEAEEDMMEAPEIIHLQEVVATIDQGSTQVQGAIQATDHATKREALLLLVAILAEVDIGQEMMTEVDILQDEIILRRIVMRVEVLRLVRRHIFHPVDIGVAHLLKDPTDMAPNRTKHMTLYPVIKMRVIMLFKMIQIWDTHIILVMKI